jgi:C-3',4' desaturase CrtD
VYDALGIPDRAVALDRAMEVVSPEGRFSLWTDRGRWAAEGRRVFPGDARATARFFDRVERLGGIVHRMASRLPVLPPRAPRDLMRLAAALRPEALSTVPYLHRTVADLLRDAGADTDPLLRRFVDAQLLDATGCTADTCAALDGAIALDLYHRGCFALPGGTAEIARDLVRALRRDGGAVRYRERVVSLRRVRGMWEARMGSGGRWRARTVIANLPAWDLPRLLGERAPASLRRTARLRRESWGAVVLHAAVDADVLPPAPYAFAQVLPSAGGPLIEGRMCFITVLPARRPGGPRVVSVSTHTAAARWWRMDRGRYAEEKARYQERLLDACERAYPGFRAGLCFAAVATPRTFAEYTHRSGGLVGGLNHTRRRSLLGAVSHRAGLPGLYLCGDSVFPGQGTIGVTLSGINAWRSCAGALGIGANLHPARAPRPLLTAPTAAEPEERKATA